MSGTQGLRHFTGIKIADKGVLLNSYLAIQHANVYHLPLSAYMTLLQTGKDSEAGKATLVGALGLEEARRELERLEGEAIASLERFGERAGILKEAARFVSRREH